MAVKHLKMYIVMRWDISIPMVVVAAAHAGLGTYLTWENDPVMQEWKNTSFRKVLCKALHYDHWQHIKKYGEHRIFTESSINGAETCIGFRVVKDPSPYLAELPLWSVS